MDGLPADHADLPARLPPEARAALARALPEVRRRLSPRGLDHWLRGADALVQMGRGEAVVLAWIDAVPELAREIGEDAIPETVTACLGFASRTSGAVIARILETAPLAARRLGDLALFRSWLRLIEHMLARAPRALRPMLDHLAQLLDVLTLGGLRRWADWGIEAHRTDPPAIEAYFALATETSRAVMQAERKGTLLVDVQRRLGMYLRALWGRDFVLVPTAGDFETRAGLRPFVAEHMLHLPDALDDWQGRPGLDLYRAQVAHLAAHLAVLRRAIPAEGLNALQTLCIGLIEDARAEALAIARFPNLRALWAPFHGQTAAGTAGVFDRLARVLLTGVAEDDLSASALAAFAAADLTDAGMSRALGLDLADRLRGLPFSAHSDRPSCPYRCDNRLLWEFEELDWSQAAGAAPAQTRRYVSVSEMVNEVEVETAGADAQEIWVQASVFFDDDGTSFNAREGKPPLGPPIPYDEFDHRLQAVRPGWATLREIRPRAGDPAQAEAILADNRKTIDRLRHLLDALRPQGTIRIRKLEDGDEIDLNAAVAAAIDTRLRHQPDRRVMMRLLRKTRDTAVLVLLDLSESTNDPVGAGQTVLGLTQAGCLLLAEAIDRVGDRLAIHGFCSDGRENVFYTRLKDFEHPWGTLAKARIMGAEGRLSTRMGTAIRHAGAHLGRVAAARKLLIVLTDGAPADIDVRDPFYLRHDARHAVEGLRRAGILPFCLTLDPRADSYAQRIFGPRNVLVLDRVERLPERLPRLYATLTR
ncbi:MAG: nitric oxide reductase activation protein NorD [Gemmobacter sp.]|uniref:nitric oxide reductase activation protein NorD n=1 Tax=Gemmobacter sp. TaxID=1898957 RepID=UPI0039193AA2